MNNPFKRERDNQFNGIENLTKGQAGCAFDGISIITFVDNKAVGKHKESGNAIMDLASRFEFTYKQAANMVTECVNNWRG